MSSPGVAPGTAIPLSAEASRRNGAKSLGPRTPEGKARSAQNALKRGLRAQKYAILPGEDAAEAAALETALIDELAPQGVLQIILVGRIARAAWRLDRADRLEAEVLEERRYGGAGPGLALIRDGNGTRSFDTRWPEPAPTSGGQCAPTNRYRGTAMAELMRSLRTLKALQADTLVPVEQAAGTARAFEARAGRATARPRPNKPERRPISEYVTSDRALPHPPRTRGVLGAKRT
jgi:hypothetical protein